MESLHVAHMQAHKGANEMAASVTRSPGGSACLWSAYHGHLSDAEPTRHCKQRPAIILLAPLPK